MNIVKKAARKMLVKLTPLVNFIDVLRTNFLYERCFESLESGFERTFVQKMHAKKEGEIDFCWGLCVD
jgi:hypothetical protein